MGTRTITRGPIAEAVARNIRAVRERRGLTQAQLAALMGTVGRPMVPTAMAKIEAGDRRVDVDDLVAFALVLNVSPPRLLVSVEDLDEVVWLAPARDTPAWTAWQWATGQHALSVDHEDIRGAEVQRRELDYMAERPTWLRSLESHPLMQAIRHLQWAATRAIQSGTSWGPTLGAAITAVQQQAKELD